MSGDRRRSGERGHGAWRAGVHVAVRGPGFTAVAAFAIARDAAPRVGTLTVADGRASGAASPVCG